MFKILMIMTMPDTDMSIPIILPKTTNHTKYENYNRNVSYADRSDAECLQSLLR